MKQVVQNLRSGELELVDVPAPRASAGHLLIQTRASLISAGTERSVVEFGQANLAAKARQNPERVRQVLERIKTEGLLPTLELVFAKLDEPMPLGYCNAGVVLDVGAGVTDWQIGDRVASNGRHAEIVNKPINLCAKIPVGVTDEQATFAVLGSIGLQGVRLIQPTLGERVAVFGLGLIGLVAVQILAASGAQVLGIDVDPARLELARQFGATPVNVGAGADPVAAGMAFSQGHGVDAVLITASAKNDSIVSQAARMSRKRGRIVLVGVVNLELNRADFYEKELSFQVSCSYGPGRYDPAYEDQGIDYPLPFVRWTEQRNMQAILEMVEAGRLDVTTLITSRVPHAESKRAYDLLANDRAQLGILLEYPDAAPRLEQTVDTDFSRNGAPAKSRSSAAAGRAAVGIIGAGLFTKLHLLPQLSKTGARLVNIASRQGLSARLAAGKFHVEKSTTDYRTILDDSQINAVCITTQHDTHVRFAVEALQAGKHVFLEKPAAIDREGLAELRETFEAISGLQLVIGFNRRFSSYAETMKRLLAPRTQPLCANMVVNAGYIPRSHWAHDPVAGGGRIIGEGCHFVDLLRFVVDRPIVAVQAMMLGPSAGLEVRDDKMSISLMFADGSVGNVHYFANGHKSLSKERLEVFCEGRVLALDNFRSLQGYGWPNFKRQRSWLKQDKGREQEMRGFIERVSQGGPPLMPPDHIWNVTEATFAAMESATTGSGLVKLGGLGTPRETEIASPALA
ncbi:MAG: bi-domain-containing oxidoreductase [Pirellulales bacterium]|nr:bi-domain-containing oxidoreductase [Pirellulales bacterium]